MRNRRTEIWLALITAGVLLPFLNRAFDIDEPLFLWMAQQVAKHPFDPYGFEINWASLLQPAWIPIQNPPFCSYFIAASAALVGWKEPALHAVFLLPAIAAILGTLALARRFCSQPAVAALIALFAPVFLISATTVMCDVLLLALWVWAIELWLRALAENRPRLFLGAAALITAATFTKYFGISLVPLLFLYTVASNRRFSWPLAYLVLPLLALLLYEAAAFARYGAPLFTNAMIYLQHSAAESKMPMARSFLTGCSFLGGCFIGALLFLRKRQPLYFAGIFVIAALCFANLAVGSHPLAVRIEGGFFAALGFIILGLALTHAVSRRDADSIFLLVWIFGTFVFATFLNWSITARTLLPALPAVAILVTRRWEERGIASSVAWRISGAAAIALLLTWADYQQSNTSRSAARFLRKQLADTNGSVWFQSHWGFQYYLQQWNAQPVTSTTTFARGDIIIVPSNNADPHPIAPDAIISRDEISLEATPFLTTFAPGTGAGFYSSARGPIPWLIAPTPVFRFEAFTVR